MIILHIITSLDGGGAENTLLKICKLLNNTKNKHLVISLKSNGVLINDFQKNNIEVYSLKLRKNIIFDIIEFFYLIKLIKRIKPTILVTWLYHADIIGLLLKIFNIFSLKLIWNIRCSKIDFRHYSKITKIIFYILKKFSKVPNLIIYNSYSGKNFHINSGYKNKNIKVIPNFINLSHWKFSKDERDKFRRKYNILDKEILISNIGRYDPQKDHDTFIKASEELIKKNFNVKFLLIGKDVKNIIINNKYREKYIFFDFQKDLKKIYSAIDILVLSSKYGEGTSNVILEAMSMSIPCIATRVGDNEKIVSKSGLLFEIGNENDLIKKIILLITEDKQLFKIRKNLCRQIIEKNYDQNLILKDFINAFK